MGGAADVAITEIRDGGREIVVEFAGGHQQCLQLGTTTRAAVGAMATSTVKCEGVVARVDAMASQLHVERVRKVLD